MVLSVGARERKKRGPRLARRGSETAGLDTGLASLSGRRPRVSAFRPHKFIPILCQQMKKMRDAWREMNCYLSELRGRMLIFSVFVSAMSEIKCTRGEKISGRPIRKRLRGQKFGSRGSERERENIREEGGMEESLRPVRLPQTRVIEQHGKRASCVPFSRPSTAGDMCKIRMRTP